MFKYKTSKTPLFFLEVPTRSLHEPTVCQSTSMGSRCPLFLSLSLWLAQSCLKDPHLHWDSEHLQCHFSPRLLSPVCPEQAGDLYRRENRDLPCHTTPHAAKLQSTPRISQNSLRRSLLSCFYSSSSDGEFKPYPPDHTENGYSYQLSQHILFSLASFPCQLKKKKKIPHAIKGRIRNRYKQHIKSRLVYASNTQEWGSSMVSKVFHLLLIENCGLNTS